MSSHWDIDEDAPAPDLLLDELPAIVWEAGGDRALRFVSASTQELLGYAAEDWLDDPDFWVALLHPEDRERVVEEVDDAVEDPDCPGVDLQYRMLDAGGEHVELYERIAIERDRRGRPVALRGVIMEVSGLHEQLAESRHRERHDALTGLPNRAALLAELDGAGDRGRFALVLLDLDRFHEINEVLGHDGGDRLIVEVAERFAGAVGALDMLAHLGGDTFAVLAPAVAGHDEAAHMAGRMRDALHAELTVGGDPVYVQASAGIVLCPADGRDAATLLRRADAALHTAKRQGRPHAFPHTAPRHATPRRLRRLAELRRGLDGGELVVHYQPTLDLQRGEVIGAEALVRWQHPHDGLLSPAEFVPLAEPTDLIAFLTSSVLEAALEQAAAWRADGRDLRVAVNLSARNLLDTSFPEEVARLLAAAGLPGERLELELAEHALSADHAETAATLTRLRELGVLVSLDNFGAGAAGLRGLRELPIDLLKIDRSLVAGTGSDDRDLRLARSAIDLGHDLGVRVVAEGVEAPGAWHRLAELGCDAAQGFALSRPLPAAGLYDWLRTRDAEGPRDAVDDESQAA